MSDPHLAKVPLDGMPWMAYRFWHLTGLEPFCLDQTISVRSGPAITVLQPTLAPELAARGGTAGLLAPAVARLPGLAELAARADAFLFSTENALE